MTAVPHDFRPLRIAIDQSKSDPPAAPLEVDGWALGDFHVRSLGGCPTVYVVTLIPLGRRLPDVFLEEDVFPLVRDLLALPVDWASLQAHQGLEIRDVVVAVMDRHDGIESMFVDFDEEVA